MALGYLIDCSSAQPSPAAIKASGYLGVLGYVSPEPGKNLKIAYAEALRSEGLLVGLVFEDAATNALSGTAKGASDAVMAVAQAKALGYPAGAVLFCNVGDFAATPVQIPAIVAYYRAFAAIVEAAGFGAGGYATGYIINSLVAAGCVGAWWQNAMNDDGTLGSIVTPNTSIYQDTRPTLPAIPGGGYDQDVLISAVELWGSSPPPPPSPPPAPSPEPEPPVQPNLSPVDLIGLGGVLDGAAPAPAGGPFYVQGGSDVFDTNAAGGIGKTFAEPFPNGLVTVLLAVGDRSPDANMGVTAIQPQCNRNGFGAVVDADGKPVAGGLVRVNWIALGF